MTARTFSMRARLLLLIIGASVCVWIVAVALSYRDARRELNALFDAQLAESGRVLLLQAEHELDEIRDESPRGGSLDIGFDHPYAQELHLQVWDARGGLVYQSTDELPREPIVAGVSNGYADTTMHGKLWRVLVLTSPESGLQIQLCQSYEGRRRLAAAIARNMLLPLVIALPLLAALIWMATSRGIRPLAHLAAELEARQSEDLAPVRVGALPRELAPVVRSLDGLFARLRDRFEVERRFTADAAHELRTPLAAVKTQAQVASGARSESERSHAVAQIVRGVDRATRLVEQLLMLARLDPDAAAAAHVPVDLAAVAREVIADPAMGVRDDVRLTAAGDAIVDGDAGLLATLVRNLLENALRHGGGDVEVLVGSASGGTTLHVIDGGPGILPEERGRVFDRFYRAAGGAPGSGLGLSIVSRIAELHGATIQLDSRDARGGLHVTVQFPTPPRRSHS